jgi:hypothetical protein
VGGSTESSAVRINPGAKPCCPGRPRAQPTGDRTLQNRKPAAFSPSKPNPQTTHHDCISSRMILFFHNSAERDPSADRHNGFSLNHISSRRDRNPKKESGRARRARGGSPPTQSPAIARLFLFIRLFCTIPIRCPVRLRLWRG